MRVLRSKLRAIIFSKRIWNSKAGRRPELACDLLLVVGKASTYAENVSPGTNVSEIDISNCGDVGEDVKMLPDPGRDSLA